MIMLPLFLLLKKAMTDQRRNVAVMKEEEDKEMQMKEILEMIEADENVAEEADWISRLKDPSRPSWNLVIEDEGEVVRSEGIKNTAPGEEIEEQGGGVKIK